MQDAPKTVDPSAEIVRPTEMNDCVNCEYFVEASERMKALKGANVAFCRRYPELTLIRLPYLCGEWADIWNRPAWEAMKSVKREPLSTPVMIAYLDAIVSLVNDRRRAGGSLIDYEESRRTDLIDSIWRMLSPEEQNAIDSATGLMQYVHRR